MITNAFIPRKIYDTQEHKILQQTIRKYIIKNVLPNREVWEEQGHCTREAWLKAGELGLLCLSVEPKFGGLGLDFSYSALIIEEQYKFGHEGPAFPMHCDIVAPYIQTYGSEYIKQKYLPKMVSGELIGALGMTEPNAGSDLQAINTIAEDKGEYYLLNGQKTFITTGFTADFTIVACKINNSYSKGGISLLVVDANLEGYTKGSLFKKIGMKTSDTCEIFFDNVKVPKTNLLGEEGKGFIYMMRELPRERLTIALQAIGSVTGALLETIKYTKTRYAFNKSVSKFQNTQFKLAEVITQLQVHTAFVDFCIELLINHKLTPEIASMAKLSTTEMQNKMLDECLQLFGGYGYIWDYPIARQWTEARVTKIYGGTNEIMKLIISRALFKD